MYAKQVQAANNMRHPRYYQQASHAKANMYACLHEVATRIAHFGCPATMSSSSSLLLIAPRARSYP
jgi:hypothetical protein